MPLPRRTVAAVARLAGPSLAAGVEVALTLRPAPAGTGVVFRHLPTGTDLPADLDHVAEVPHCTSLQAGSARIDFVEHPLAALAAAGVTDVVVEVDGGEAPLLDGSALPYCRAIAQAGVVALDAEVAPIVLADTGVAHCREGAAIIATPGSGLTYLLDHAHPLIGRQCAVFRPEADAFERLAAARTFATEEEARALLAARGLRGGSEELAIIAYADRLSAPEPFPGSFAAHKIVDLLGDLYLLGRPVHAQIVACRTGHRDNRELARRIVAPVPGQQ